MSAGEPPEDDPATPPGRGAPSERKPVLSDPDLLSGRLFFAVPVPGSSRAPLEAVLPRVALALPGARIATAAGWHLTLAFLGQVRPESAAEVVRVGETAVVGVPVANLRLDGAGGFPTSRRARVLWAGVGGEVEVLARLARTLAEECRRSGLRYEEREPHPHLTMARLQKPMPLPAAALELITAAAAASPPWQARELCCYRSVLSRSGARYQVIRRFPLGRP
ncbi:MAG TPA: RNA 2',3'-cyclic phosphodiesterase [Actinomycetes bacterium]|jgi:2'-5' RNA ligase|nr:RNA 2',3'-cyclic phosphodiesterase [Actinomycetes bacterium]